MADASSRLLARPSTKQSAIKQSDACCNGDEGRQR